MGGLLALPLFLLYGGDTMAKKTALQLEWAKEIRRIKGFIKRIEKRGYTIDYELPTQPKRITKQALRELRSETTAPKMYKRATYTTKEGELISGTKARTEERKKAARKGQLSRKKRDYNRWKEERAQEKRDQRWEDRQTAYQTGAILWKLRNELGKWTRMSIDQRLLKGRPDFINAILAKKDNANGLLALLDECIAKEGERRVVLRLEAKATEINEALSDFNRSSTSGDVESATVRLATLIKGSSLTQEESEYFTSEFEDFEDFDFPDIER